MTDTFQQQIDYLVDRIIKLENARSKDTQAILAFQETIRSYDAYFKNQKPPIDYTPVLKDQNARLVALEIAFVHKNQKSAWNLFKR